MSSETMVFGAPTRRTEKWRVYRIRTANSLYELEVQAEQPASGRRCAVLTKLDERGGSLQSFEDSAPRIGDAVLYDVSVLEWIGKRLAVGTACTSDVQSVDFVTTTSARTPRNTTMYFGGPASAPATQRQPSPPQPAPRQQAAPRDWAPFPLGSVEMLEAAAAVLGNVCHRHDLMEALQHDPHLAKRFTLALAQCGVLVESLDRRRRSDSTGSAS